MDLHDGSSLRRSLLFAWGCHTFFGFMRRLFLLGLIGAYEGHVEGLYKGSWQGALGDRSLA